ncbi:Protein pangolin J [Fasciola gigantica]|uniref:Protein pangolin J n=1 Tax=Fasciola gigantica TaxID=46835 RepID=A0A504Z1T3_FASGI|nr:Protein pangolin J [Fasciola gigantica]
MHSRRKKKRRLAAAVAAAQQAGLNRVLGKSGPAAGTAAIGTGITGLGSTLTGEFGTGEGQGLTVNPSLGDLGSAKKCRARFGLEHQHRWCKPCRRKKKCIRFLTDAEYDESEFPSSPTSTGIPGIETTGVKTVTNSRDSNPRPISLYTSNMLPASASSVTDLARCSSSSSEPSVSQSGTGTGTGASVDLWSSYVPNLPGSGPKPAAPTDGDPTTSVPDTPSFTSYTLSSRTSNPGASALVRRQSADSHAGVGDPEDRLNRLKREPGEELTTSGQINLAGGSSCPIGGNAETHSTSHLTSIIHSFSASGCG